MCSVDTTLMLLKLFAVKIYFQKKLMLLPKKDFHSYTKAIRKQLVLGGISFHHDGMFAISTKIRLSSSGNYNPLRKS